MTKIGSDLFKISKFNADSESEIRFSKKSKTIPKPCVPTGILFQIKKVFFFEFSTIELPRKNSLNKIKNRSKLGLFDPTYDHQIFTR